MSNSRLINPKLHHQGGYTMVALMALMALLALFAAGGSPEHPTANAT
jgi:hypothetical protein